MDRPRDGELSIDNALERLGFGRFHLRLLLMLGCVQAADAVASSTDAFLATHLDCVWGTRNDRILPYVSQVGVVVGAVTGGLLADLYGRRPLMLLACLTGSYYIVVSILAYHAPWFLAFRFLQNAAVASIKGVSLTYVAELVGWSYRAKLIVTYQLFWTAGALVTTLLAFALLPMWRLLLLLTALPLVFAGILLAFMPQSPASLLLRGFPEEAQTILQKVALSNQAPKPPNLAPVDDSEETAASTNRRSPCRRRWTLYLFCTSFTMLWLLTGLLTTSSTSVVVSLPLNPAACLPASILMTDFPGASYADPLPAPPDTSCCRAVTRLDYNVIAQETVHYAVGGMLAFLAVDTLGRRKTMACCSFMATVLFLPLNFCLPSLSRRALLVLTLSFTAAAKSALAVYTLELLPTRWRALGYGLCAALEAVGAMLAPLVVLLAEPWNRVQDSYILNTVILLVSAVLAVVLPVETGKKPLCHTLRQSRDRILESDAMVERPTGYHTFYTAEPLRRR